MMKADRSCDVLVVGGGVSGSMAALASARSNVRTVLIEREDFLGGAGYAGLLQHICGLYINSEEIPSGLLNEGIVHEIVGGLRHLSPHKKVRRIGSVHVLPYKREDLRHVLSSLCSEEPGLSVLYNARAVSVKKEQESVTRVNVQYSGASFHLFPTVLIDCSGSGSVSAMAGARFELSPSGEIQMAGYIIRLKGMKDVDESLAVKVPYYLSEAVSRKLLPQYLKFTTFSPGDSPDEGYCKMSIDSAGGEEREQKAAEDAQTAFQYLSDRLPAFRGSEIAETSRGVLEREGRRVTGEYILTEEDILNHRKFHDGVVKNSWPIELWDKKKGTLYKYVKPGEYYEIPFRCLKVKGINNLLCAGRCISVTHEALGSTRVMGTCMSLGEQAGRAAAYYVKHGRYPYVTKNL